MPGTVLFVLLILSLRLNSSCGNIVGSFVVVAVDGSSCLGD